MKKGFTLLELLIVVGILAILATTMVLVINPAEMLRRARDSQRITDLNALKTAIALYATEVSDLNIGSDTVTYSRVSSVSCADRAASSTTSQAINGSGWIPINFTQISGGSPISNLPKDPNESDVDDNPSLYYVYLTNTADNTFELIANMESASYAGTESGDGGLIDTLFETGTKIGIVSSTNETCFPHP